MNKSFLRRFSSLLSMISLVSMVLIRPADVFAAGITAMSVTGTGITLNSAALNTAITPTVNYTTATALNLDGQTIYFELNGMSVAGGQTLIVTDITMTGCTSNTLEATPGTADNGAHEVTITNGAAGNDNPTVLITLDNTAGPTPPSCAAGAKTLVVAVSQLVSHDTTVGNYAISIVTTFDYGAFFFYVGDDNDVNITGSVTPILAFAIRNSADTADTNACPLGALTLAGVNTCAYRLKVTTNATSGYTVQVTTDGDLRKSGSGDVADNLDIDLIVENNTVTAGTEGYGIAFVGGSVTGGGSCTEQGDFNDDDTPLPMSATNLVICSSPNAPASPDTTNTSLVTHRAAMDGNTTAGYYSQVSTYYVSASF
jgi:hypothetical protein